jgi:hypothetical protein
MQSQLVFVVLILLGVSLFPGCGGQRYLNARIERDGELVLQTEYGVPDRWDTAAMWRSLQGKSFKAVGPVKPETDDRQMTLLKGKIRIAILHVTRVIASAEVDELRISCPSGSSDQWQLPNDEVERTARVAGL